MRISDWSSDVCSSDLGLLSRVYLYDGQWENAAKAAKDVIDLQQYDLTHSYTTQFTEEGENSNDVIFAARFLDAPGFSTGEPFSATSVGAPKVDKQHIPNPVRTNTRRVGTEWVSTCRYG